MNSRRKYAAAPCLPGAIVATALAACQPSVQPTTEAPIKAASLSAAAQISATLNRYAVNALVLTLLDDADLPRFTRAAMPLMCGDDSEVSINGDPVVEGVEAPTGSFVLQWSLRGFCPFGVTGPLLDGDINVVVLRDDDFGIQAIVLPPRFALLAQRIDEP